MNGLGILSALVLLSLGVSASPVSHYGVNAHLTRNEFENHRQALEMMRLAGIRHVRVPMTYAWVCTNGVCDFATCDEVMANCREIGIEPLPVVDCVRNGPAEANALAENPTELVRFMRELLTHFRGRFKTLEFWNEPNIDPFWKAPNAANYVKLLKIVRKLQREIDPKLRIAIAGMSKVPIAYLRQCYEAGAKDAFDIMNVHPYTQPGGPERIEPDLRKLRALMTEFGDGDKPIWISEIGWSTQLPSLTTPDVLKTGILKACGDRKLRVAYCEMFPEGPVDDQRTARLVRAQLPRPRESDVVCVAPRACARLMDERAVDVVVLPPNQYFPADALDAAERFVKKGGGTLVAFSMLPLWRGVTDVGAADGLQNGEALQRFGVAIRSKFSRNGNYPASLDMGGRPVTKYLVGENLEPVVHAPDATGRELVGAGIFRFPGGGSFFASTLPADNPRRAGCGQVTERMQAALLARALALSFRLGVEAVYSYEFRSWDHCDPWESETHYGLLHANFCPKPSYSAYMNFTSFRPEGSRNLAIGWKACGDRVYYPQWQRPDGKVAGVLWSLDAPQGRTLLFDGAVEFYTLFGERFLPKSPRPGCYVLEVTSLPVYFINHRLTEIN